MAGTRRSTWTRSRRSTSEARPDGAAGGLPSFLSASHRSYCRELELEALFKTYEQESYDRLCKTIEEQDLVPKEVFMSLLRKIYKRSK